MRNKYGEIRRVQKQIEENEAHREGSVTDCDKCEQNAKGKRRNALTAKKMRTGDSPVECGQGPRSNAAKKGVTALLMVQQRAQAKDDIPDAAEGNRLDGSKAHQERDLC